MDAKAAETVKSINALAPRRRSKMKMERSRSEDFEVASSLVKKQFGKSTGTDRSNQKQKSLIKYNPDEFLQNLLLVSHFQVI